MDKSLHEALSALNASQSTMVGELHTFCEINSGSEHLPGLAQLRATLQAAFTPLADLIIQPPLPPRSTINMTGETITQPCGNALYIRKRPELTRRVLLSGHMDTVYASDHPFQQLTYLSDNIINGPGVADMKGGLVVMLHALTAFERLPIAATLGWDVFINADEELGSPASRSFLEEITPLYQAALVYEPTMTPEGTLAKNRKGSGQFTLIATGLSAHAGRSFNDGRNAICYLAEAINQIHALNGKQDGVSINVGMIAGGSALNVVPNKAIAKLDVRISNPTEADWVTFQLKQIIHTLRRNDYTLTLRGGFHRPVKRINPATERLFNQIVQQGKTLGLTLDWKDSGGCCDGNNLSQQGLPVLDTLGVRGGHIHSPHEFILLDSLVERSALSLLLLADLTNGGLEALTS